MGKTAGRNLDPFPQTRAAIRLPKLPNTGHFTFPKGPAVFRKAPTTAPWLPLPDWWSGRSELEYIVFWGLTKVFRKYPSVAPAGYPGPWGTDFIYQSPFEQNYGVYRFGSIIVDFVMTEGSGIALNPIGAHWHWAGGTGQQARDLAQAAELLRYGFVEIFLDEVPLREAPIPLLRDALAGIDRSTYAKGGGF